MRILGILFLVLAIIFGGAVYIVFIRFSEHREYSPMSFEYYLLTPPELSAMTKLCTDRPNFIYSAADGPKPTSVTMNCTIDREEFESYMKSNGFKLDDGQYNIGRTQIGVTHGPLGEKIFSVIVETNTLGATGKTVSARSGYSVNPSCGFHNHPSIKTRAATKDILDAIKESRSRS